MAGIIPTTASGATTVRGTDGVRLTPAGVTNAYCPDAAFTSTCAIEYLPDTCEARITAAQINGFQSEMMCLAERFNPDGGWDCDSLCNLSGNFNAWQADQGADNTLWRQLQTHLCAMDAVTNTVFSANAAATWITCDGAGNINRVVPPDMFNTALEITDAICADATALASLQACLSPHSEVAVGDGLTLATTVVANANVYTVSADPQSIMNLICADATAKAALQACIDPYPVVAQGSRITVVETTGVNGETIYTLTGQQETITVLKLNAAGDALVYTDERGVDTAVAFPATGFQSVVTNEIAGNRIATHDDGNGTLVDIDETITTFVANGNGSYTYTSENGTVTQLPAPATGASSQITNVIAGNRIATHDNGLGGLTDIFETATTLVEDALAGEMVYTSEAGVETRFDIDTGVTAHALTWSTTGRDFVSSVTSNGNTIISTLDVPAAATSCDNRSIGFDRVTGALQSFPQPMPYLHNPNRSVAQFSVNLSNTTQGQINLDTMATHPNYNAALDQIEYNNTYNIDVTGIAGGCEQYLNGWAEVLVTSSAAIDQLEFGTVNAEITTQFQETGGIGAFLARVGGDNVGAAGATTGSAMDSRGASAIIIKLKLAAGVVSMGTLARIPRDIGTTGMINVWDASMSARVVGIVPVF